MGINEEMLRQLFGAYVTHPDGLQWIKLLPTEKTNGHWALICYQTKEEAM